MRGLGDMFGIYAIWSDSSFAQFVRSTAITFIVLGAQWLLIVWLWSLAPAFMTFALPIAYICWMEYWDRRDRREACERLAAIEAAGVEMARTGRGPGCPPGNEY